MEKNNTAAERRPGRPGEERIEIDLLELLGVFMDEWNLVALCALAGALLLNAWSYFLVHPTYEATSKLYIVSASKDSMVDITDLNLGTSLTA
ncbi:MAG: capsular polysaccharide biosynthesis protein, partial [Lachnospiraceae bacterium]|nr:capsular polysaccharide biosynthesis protein [Lachnospiraceae bacterium]